MVQLIINRNIKSPKVASPQILSLGSEELFPKQAGKIMCLSVVEDISVHLTSFLNHKKKTELK